MSQSATVNRQLVLAERPRGEPTLDTLRLEEGPVPEPGPGELLLRTVYLSLDPYMRGRMSAAPSYAAPVELGQVMIGGTVSRVVRSNVDGFSAGDWVLGFSGWQDYAISDGKGLSNLGPAPARPSWALGVLGMPGFTAWAGLEYIGEPVAGETLVVAAATGPVGATVAQIAKLRGCRVVGIAGGPEKCAHGVSVLGMDACLDRKADDFAAQLKQACPDGIDIYWENVGGPVLDAVLPLLNTRARVPVCGLISQYNKTRLPEGPDRMNWLMGLILRKRLTVRGFIIFDDYGHHYPKFAAEVSAWIQSGEIAYTEEILDGLDQALPGFIGLLKGDNFGKRVIQVGPDDLS